MARRIPNKWQRSSQEAEGVFVEVLINQRNKTEYLRHSSNQIKLKDSGPLSDFLDCKMLIKSAKDHCIK